MAGKAVTPRPRPKRQTPKKQAGKQSASTLDSLPRAPKIAQLEMGGNVPSAVHNELPSSFTLLAGAFRLVWNHRGLLLGYALLYMVFNLALVQGLNSSTNLTGLKHSLEQTHSHSGFIGFSLYTYLLGNTGQNVSPFAGVYQLLLALFVSLAVIWSVRQIYAGYEVRIRDGFYRGMYPLVPFLLVILMIFLQLVPFLVGSGLYSIVMANGLAVNAGEQIVFLLIFLAATLVSLYMLCSSLIALYVVTLPEMTPMAALRSARDLVAHRRWTIMRKILFLPISLFILASIILVPISLVATAIAPWALAVVSTLVLVLIHTYMYSLYRALL